MKRKNNYDFVSDVHGRLDLLESLLIKAGYIKDDEGIFYHPKGRIAFFLGDIIDKGNQVYETFFLVKRMVEKGYAKIVLGNHELNFIAIHTKDNNGNYLRERKKSKLKQIEKSLDLLNNKDEVFSFIYSIPLFYEDDNIRVIHACWDEKSLNCVKKFLDQDYCLSNVEKYKDIFKNKQSFNALEVILKGIEIDIKPQYYLDKNGEKRYTCRLNWWEKNKIIETVPNNFQLSQSSINMNQMFYNSDKLVFFGHYTKGGKPYIQSKKALCLDFCKNGYLTMYCYSGEDEIIENNIIYVK
jgi:hypothetical protein